MPAWCIRVIGRSIRLLMNRSRYRRFGAFFTPVDYYSTRAHETGHWTSRAGRCNRELGKRFGDNAYCVEELIAELTAAFTLAHLGLSSEPHVPIMPSTSLHG